MPDSDENTEDEERFMKERNESRFKVTLVVFGGFLSALFSNQFLQLSEFVSLSPPVVSASIVLLIFWGVFQKPGAKLILFTYLVTITTWFLTGTFILNL